MTLERAYSILGQSAHGVPFNNMIRALQMLPWLNGPKEVERLEAALWVRRNRKRYNAYCAEQRDRRKR